MSPTSRNLGSAKTPVRAFRVLLLGALLAPLGVGAASAHDMWSNGDPVPSWVKKACCGPEDVHHLSPEPAILKVSAFPKITIRLGLL